MGRKSERKMAERADRYEVYQKAVQNPETDMGIFLETYRDMRGKLPRVIREDFCGTAFVSTEWVKGDPERRALAVDRDSEPLEWGFEHNIRPAGKGVEERIELICSDVLEVETPPVDIVCAMNFSFYALKMRRDLHRYFGRVRSSLKSDGLFIFELYGGTEAIIATEEERDGEGFTYRWEQERFNPLTHETRCHISFSFPDGSRLDRAFTYDWRLWSIPEVRDCLNEAGFSNIRVFWEAVDEDGVGTGEYRETTEEENQETWLVYIVASM